MFSLGGGLVFVDGSRLSIAYCVAMSRAFRVAAAVVSTRRARVQLSSASDEVGGGICVVMHAGRTPFRGIAQLRYILVTAA